MAAMRACEAIEKCQFRHHEKELRVTMSFGVAEVLGDEDGAMLVARADKALYAAKKGGRNCAYRHDGETVERIVGDMQQVDRTSTGQPPSRSTPSQPGETEKDNVVPVLSATMPKPALWPRRRGGFGFQSALPQRLLPTGPKPDG